ncbi:poly-gamma-glutamate hydrolase family protein [Natrialba taiwanensis]|uniref:poly-gamma-glutamate hydrolase family protein n=1 Tax=Natrialba taiwanensis TaxID=160846 RepID=UPI001267EF31
MGSPARDRLYDSNTTTPDTFGCEFIASIPHQTSKSEAEADSRGELWEQTVSHPSHEFVATAPHAGDVEYNTGYQARKCHEYLANSSLWVCDSHGGVNGAFDRWHITSTDVSSSSYPGLTRLESVGYTAAVSFHGYSGDTVLVGGRAPDTVKQKIVDSLNELGGATAEVVGEGDSLSGTDTSNYVNQITQSGDDGIQLEQPYSFRDNYAEESARRVAKVILQYYD